IGINAMVLASSAAIGPTIAEAIVSVGHWRWLFAINVLIGILAVLIASRALRHTERSHRKLNHIGALLYFVTFALVLSGLQTFAHDGVPILALVQVSIGCVTGVVLVRHELPRAAPLIPFDLLRIRLFTLSLATS